MKTDAEKVSMGMNCKQFNELENNYAAIRLDNSRNAPVSGFSLHGFPLDSMSLILMILWLTSFSSPLGADQWRLPADTPEPEGLSERAQALQEPLLKMVRNGSAEDIRWMQRRVFVTEGIAAMTDEPAEKAAIFGFLRGDFELARASWNVPAKDGQYPKSSTDGPQTHTPSMAFWGHTPHRGDRTFLEGASATGQLQNKGSRLLGRGGRIFTSSTSLYQAHLAFIDKRFTEAAALYEQAAGGGGDDGRWASYFLGLCQIRMTGVESSALADLAAFSLKRVQARVGMEVEEILDLAWGLKFLGRTDEAIEICKKLYGHIPNDPRLFYLYGTLMQVKNRLEEARGAYARAINLNADHPMVSLAYSTVCLALDKIGDGVGEKLAAETMYDSAWKPGPGAVWYNREPADVLKRVSPDSMKLRLDAAEAAFRTAAAGGPTKTLGLEGLGDVAYLRGLATSAIDLYLQASGENPLGVSARLKAVAGLLLARRIPQALGMYLEGIDLTALPLVYNEFARLQVDHETLIRSICDVFALYLYDALAALQADYEDSASRQAAAAIYAALLFSDKALTETNILRGNLPKDRPIARLWAMTLWRDARYAQRELPPAILKEAATALESALGAAPDPAAEYVLAEMCGSMNDQAKRRVHLKRSLAQKAEAPETLFPLAVEAYDQKDFKESRDLFERLLAREYSSRTAAVARRKYQNLLERLQETGRTGGER